MNAPAAAAPSRDALLAPLSDDAPCGPAARHDPVFTDIRLLREEDDPSLPMGQWERPLKRADWPAIVQLCSIMLATRSKDLQILAWLVEAWLRQRGFAGLLDGLRLCEALLRSYWPALHPVIEADGDADARLAPFEWLNESLSASVRLHAVLLTLEDPQPFPLTLAAWERMTAQEMAPAAPPPGPDVQATRADVFAAMARGGAALAPMCVTVGLCLDTLRAIVAFMRGQMGDAAPVLAKLDATLAAALRLLTQLQAGQAAPAPPDDGLYPDVAVLPEVAVQAVPMAPAGAANQWRNRAEAYATLGALADYLSAVEPHSPTPFLIRRAVNWGNMTLPEVIAEIIREEGDVSRLFNVLGIRT
jgi:type VI secretion system protein ImpA